VDGRRNRRNKAAFSNSSGVGYCRYVDEKGHYWKRRRKLAKIICPDRDDPKKIKDGYSYRPT